MAGMNGAETFREIGRVGPEAFGVVVTAYSDSVLMAEALQVGSFVLMRKPCAVAEPEVVLKYVRRSRAG